MVTKRIYENVEEFTQAYWVSPYARKRNGREVTEQKYILRNMSGTIRGATSGYSPYLQAWMLKSGKVLAKVSWGCYTSRGVEEFAEAHGEELEFE